MRIMDKNLVTTVPADVLAISGVRPRADIELIEKLDMFSAKFL